MDSDRRIANTRDGKPVWIRPRRGVRGGAPAARRTLYRAAPGAWNPTMPTVAVASPRRTTACDPFADGQRHQRW